jgi:peptidoglycan/xylan/chitin deacetylase (PgdA/CDA1 family)
MIALIIFLHSIRWCGIGLTLDDGPTKGSYVLLDYLDHKKIPAMFFPTGKMMELFPDFVGKAVEKGYSFGNHTYDHAEMPHITQKHRERTIRRQHELLLSQGAIAPVWFRYPSGKRNRKITRTLESLRYVGIADWDAFSGDIFKKPPEHAFRIMRKVLKTQDTAVVLFHDCNPGVVTRVRKFVSLVEEHNRTVNLFEKGSFLLTFVRPETTFRGEKYEFDR